MKNKISIFLILFILTTIPTNVFAASYEVNRDLTIEIDNSDWITFTKDDINNSKLKELNINYNDIRSEMEENNIYLESFLINNKNRQENISLFIKISEDKMDIGNLHSYPKEKINSIGNNLLKSEIIKADNFTIYENDYAFIKFEYQDNNYNLYQFYTYINGHMYAFSFQKENKISLSEKNMMNNIVDNIEFQLDEDFEQAIDFSSTFEKAITAGIIGAITAGIFTIMVFKKEKDKQKKVFKFKYNKKLYITCTLLCIGTIIMCLFKQNLICYIFSIILSYLSLKFSKNKNYLNLPISLFYISCLNLLWWNNNMNLFPKESIWYNFAIAGICAILPALVLYLINKTYVDFKYYKDNVEKNITWEKYKKKKKNKTLKEVNIIDDKEENNDKFVEIRKYKELLDENIITKEEFEKKKKELLDLK